MVASPLVTSPSPTCSPSRQVESVLQPQPVANLVRLGCRPLPRCHGAGSTPCSPESGTSGVECLRTSWTGSRARSELCPAPASVVEALTPQNALACCETEGHEVGGSPGKSPWSHTGSTLGTRVSRASTASHELPKDTERSAENAAATRRMFSAEPSGVDEQSEAWSLALCCAALVL